uniref:Uncharacterized protein n=1 Tax=Oryza sativa subsp. japonica TaxID=39947 RepID=Q7EYJ5_ORYSJ|nr:hypothetical protein [Oryza sativa Japonica Group]
MGRSVRLTACRHLTRDLTGLVRRTCASPTTTTMLLSRREILERSAAAAEGQGRRAVRARVGHRDRPRRRVPGAVPAPSDASSTAGVARSGACHAAALRPSLRLRRRLAAGHVGCIVKKLSGTSSPPLLSSIRDGRSRELPPPPSSTTSAAGVLRNRLRCPLQSHGERRGR